jgi:hypothetical protein
MIPLTPEQREYKERTLNQLLINLPLLEAKLAQESQRNVIISLHEQLEATEAQIVRLQKELANEVMLESVADELCRQAASALTKQKLYMAKRYINKLETIEPFYPEIERLKLDAETGQVSRRTRALAQSTPLPMVDATNIPLITAGPGVRPASQPAASAANGPIALERGKERGGFAQFFQFHIIASCLVVLLIMCVMAGVGGMSVLRWLIEGS